MSEDQDAKDAKNRSEEVSPDAALDNDGDNTGVDEEECKNATAEAVARGENTMEDSAEAVAVVVVLEGADDEDAIKESRDEAVAEGGGDTSAKESDTSLGVVLGSRLGLAEFVEGDFLKNKF